jgi:hypothetical protein
VKPSKSGRLEVTNVSSPGYLLLSLQALFHTESEAILPDEQNLSTKAARSNQAAAVFDPRPRFGILLARFVEAFWLRTGRVNSGDAENRLGSGVLCAGARVSDGALCSVGALDGSGARLEPGKSWRPVIGGCGGCEGCGVLCEE